MAIENYVEKQLSLLFREQEFSQYFLIEVRATGNRVEVFVDGDNGVSLDACQKISRRLEAALETDHMVAENYTLDVSSPGADRPLQQKRQYAQHVGRKLRVSLKDGTRVTGKLVAASGSGIVLVVKNKKETEERSIDFPDINESIVQISFN